MAFFGLLTLSFLIAQVILYVKFCTSRRNSWSIRRKDCHIHTMSFTCPWYDRARENKSDRFTVTAIPCKPGLAYSASTIRSGDLVNISPVEEGPGKVWHGGSFRMAQSNYASVFMVDPRGHFGPHLQAAPAATLQLYRAKRSNTMRATSQDEKSCNLLKPGFANNYAGILTLVFSSSCSHGLSGFLIPRRALLFWGIFVRGFACRDLC